MSRKIHTHNVFAVFGECPNGGAPTEKRFMVGKAFTDNQGRIAAKLDVMPVATDWDGWIELCRASAQDRQQGQPSQGEYELELVSEPEKKPTCVLPKGWERMNAMERKQARVNINSKLMNRVGKMLGRREGTLWTVAEAVALKTVDPKPEEIDLMESYYLDEIDQAEDFRRRDLATLLNNWNVELDRARIYHASK